MERGRGGGDGRGKVHDGETGGNRDGPGHIGALGLEELREVVRDRSAWRMLSMTVARSQRIDGKR